MSIREKIATAEPETFFTEFFTDEEWETRNTLALLGYEIECARIELGKSQEEFADLMGVTQGMVSRWENGEYNFTIKKLSEIAVKLGRKVESFFIHDKGYEDYKADEAKTVESRASLEDIQNIYRSIAESRHTQSKQRSAYRNFTPVNNQGFNTGVENCA